LSRNKIEPVRKTAVHFGHLDSVLVDSTLFPYKDYSRISNEIVLFIINRNSGLAPYSHEFVEGGHDPQILSGFISAMSDFMGEVTGEQQSRWKTVYGGQTTLLVESGEWSVGVLAVLRETNEARSKLRIVIKEFEDAFSILRDTEHSEASIFRDFDHFVRRVYSESRFSEESVILKGPESNANPQPWVLPSWNYRVTKFLNLSVDHQTLTEAADVQNLHLEDIKELASRAHWNRNIHILYVPTLRDVLHLSEGSSSILFDKSVIPYLSPDTLRVIGALDGRSPLSSILKYKKISKMKLVQVELGVLINHGYLQKVSMEKLFVLINEDILSGIARICGKEVGSKRTRDYFDIAITNCVDDYPWLSRVILTGSLRCKCLIEDGVTPGDLDMICDSLEVLQRHVLMNYSSDKKLEDSESILRMATEKAQKKWKRLVRDEVFI
jgi:hypothetical protein